MNGEMHQICMLVSAVRTALATASPIYAAIDDHVDAISFVFQADGYMAHTVDDWFSHCVSRGLADMKMLCPTGVRDRQILGFANNPGRCSMAAFYSDCKATCWTAYWEFVPDRKKWKVFYTENEWEDASGEKLIFEDNTEQFSVVLREIATFADRIGFSDFGDIFRSALHVLEGVEPIPGTYPNGRKVVLPSLTEEKKRIFFAASKADVFGAMGSWNDSSPWAAHEKGLEYEYNQLSEELLRQLRLAALYAVNENQAGSA